MFHCDVAMKVTSKKKCIIQTKNFSENHLHYSGLNPERLKEFGIKKSALDLVEKGIPVNLSHPLFPGDIKTRRNSRNIQNNFSVVKNLISSLEMAGQVQKVDFKPLVVSPLNLVPKANGSPRLIQDLSLLNKFVK